jgi:hypothetical protein
VREIKLELEKSEESKTVIKLKRKASKEAAAVPESVIDEKLICNVGDWLDQWLTE